MSAYQEFRRGATYCANLAQTITNPADKLALLEMSRRWAELAEGVKHLEPRTVVITTPTPDVVVPFRRRQD